MDSKITIESRRHQRRRNRETDRSNSNDSSRRTANTSQSPPQQHSRVVILAKNPNQKSITPSNSSQLSGTQSTTTTPIQTVQIMPSLHSSQQKDITSNTLSASSVTDSIGHQLLSKGVGVSTQSTTDEMVTTSLPSVMRLIDSDYLTFNDSLTNDHSFSDSLTSNFSVISALGLDGVGKSSVLNLIAGKDVFKVHKKTNFSERPLKHRTRGIDLHITKERLFLLDSQPLLSASVLDEYLLRTNSCPRQESSTGVDISEPENYSFMISLQILSLMLTICDYVIIVNDWMFDIHIIKLLSTAVMMIGDSAHKADIVFYFPKINTKVNTNAIESLLGRSLYFTVIYGDENELLNAVMKSPSKPIAGENGRNSAHNSEKSWLLWSQRYWETSIRKSTLYSEYGRILP